MNNYDLVKRVLDILVSLISIIILWPIAIIIAIVVKVDSKGPVLFSQKRVGKNGSTFSILKFRTMSVDAPQNMPTHLLEKPENCITRSGKILRKTSLDELPQVINIIKGEMSFVGPRPALWNQYDLITHRETYSANSVLPGLTGLAQISGRDELDLEEKAKLDGIYAKKRSLYYDVEIVVKTFFYVIKSKGVIEGESRS